MSNHNLSYSVAGTPAEILHEVLREEMWLAWASNGEASLIPGGVYEYALQHTSEDDDYFLTEEVESILMSWLAAHADVTGIYRWIREEFYDSYFQPVEIGMGGSFSDDHRARLDAALTPEQHYHWAFVAEWQPHPVKGEGWALV